ncbi:MAG: type II toxin-antitoxin system RelE/ParE family toxin [Gammaproteobacteria bacterium]|nr:type II toxin-antitoxin system RelE/ParE family toxin [Gammaproteobacteria bacterium]MCF6259579.1 type II toxin-antitoxin system RelE/ParE family toxin [Gammaproteobacteria bacterium]
MAESIIWSQEALDDIDGIAEFISRDSLHYAQQVVERLFELGDAIVEHPKAGRIVPEFENADIRERFLYSYRLIYEIRASEICVLAVIHGKRLLETD